MSTTQIQLMVTLSNWNVRFRGCRSLRPKTCACQFVLPSLSTSPFASGNQRITMRVVFPTVSHA
ncbi:hypothetical protein BCU43_025740, partial [Vibrio lentus]